MQQEIKENPVLSAVDKIFQKGHRSKFSDQFQKSILGEAQVIADYLGIESLNQAMTFAMLVGMGVQANSALDIEQFSNYLNVSVLRALQFSDDLNSLTKKKLLSKQKNTRRRRGRESLNYLNFYVPSDIVEAIVTKQPLPPRRALNLNHFELLSLVLELYGQREDSYLEQEELENEIQNLLEEHKQLTFVKKILKLKLPVIEQLILLLVCEQFVEGNQTVLLIPLLKTIFPEIPKQITCRKEWINGKTKLQQVGLVDLEMDSSFRNDKAIQLTPKGQELFGSDRSMFVEVDTHKHKNIILSSSIVEKKLFFNEKESQQLARLYEFINPEKHEEIVQKLSAMKFSTGLCVLFHGKPGTGKTESVLQIARQTGRDIFKVEIAEWRSKWYGESQRLAQSIFANYRKLLDSSTGSSHSTDRPAPILLLNEIDAILGSRKDLGSSSTDQAESGIIGIVLNEMETFPSRGILVATSNLPRNLDKALERRFSAKIYFDSPDSRTRSLIWKENLTNLTDMEIEYLSAKFSFSGGQIVNIVKKTQIEILMGRSPDLRLIEEFCQEETLESPIGSRKIGYL